MNLSFKALSFLGLVGVGAGVGGTYGSVVKTNAEENKKFMEAKKELSSSWKNFASLFDSILKKYKKVSETDEDVDDNVKNKWNKFLMQMDLIETHNPRSPNFQSTSLNDLQNKKQKLEEMSKELKEISKSLGDN